MDSASCWPLWALSQILSLASFHHTIVRFFFTFKVHPSYFFNLISSYTLLFLPVLSVLLFASYFPYCPFVIPSCGSVNLKCNYLFIKQAFLKCFIVSSSFFTYFIGLISTPAFWPGWLSLDKILVDTKHCGWLVGFCLFICLSSVKSRSLLLYKYKRSFLLLKIYRTSMQKNDSL